MSSTKAAAVPVPDSILKKKEKTALNKEALAKKAAQRREKAKKNRELIVKRAADYASEYKNAKLELKKQKNEAQLQGNIFVEPEAKVAVVTRLRGVNGVPPKVKKILRLFRLLQIGNTVLVRINKATINMLRWIEAYVAYGYPNLKTIKKLVYKRGYGKVHGQRKRLVDNSLISSSLGKHGIICAEDLIHELYTCGPKFKEAANFLWPFKLPPPRGGFVNKLIHFNEGGDAGNRGKKINELIQRMA